MLLVQRRNIVIAFVITILLTFSALLLPTQTNANQTMKLEYIIAQVGNEQIVVDLIDYAMALANTKQDFLVYLKNGKSAPDVKGVVING